MNGKEFKKALDNIVKEKDIDPEVVYNAMELALTSAYKKNFNSKTNVKVLFDRATGEIKVYSFLTVVESSASFTNFAFGIILFSCVFSLNSIISPPKSKLVQNHQDQR